MKEEKQVSSIYLFIGILSPAHVHIRWHEGRFLLEIANADIACATFNTESRQWQPCTVFHVGLEGKPGSLGPSPSLAAHQEKPQCQVSVNHWG